jgi:NAD(P)H dehydrogenase (quinone)
MHALIVLSHPNPHSFSHAIAAHVAQGVAADGQDHTAEIADLAAEGFDPRFTRNDVDVSNKETPPAADVIAEQKRVDRADALVLVYPVYWWSMPGLLKGWIDRVLTNGWAYDYGSDLRVVKKLRRLTVHLVAHGAADMKTYQKYGYQDAMKKQIDEGIFDYCGARVLTSQLLIGLDDSARAADLETALNVGRGIFESSKVEVAA